MNEHYESCHDTLEVLLSAIATELPNRFVQENVPIKIVVFNNGNLGFIDIEQRSAGLTPMYTDLKNPDFGEVAKAMGLWGHSVTKAGDLEELIKTWLAQPGPALLDVKVNPMQLVMAPWGGGEVRSTAETG